MKYEILDSSGRVTNTILASQNFVEQNYAGRYREVAEIEPTQEELAAEQAAAVRAERNEKLAASDWTQLADSTADKGAWATYRQALRDITAQAGFPWAITWPTQPE
jgi:hypothetical protein